LVDYINKFLLYAHSKGRKPVLIIDEAQNLSVEVLEQLRLLTNLETNERKLLQIILVGQPELGEILDSYEMRQLKQRINLSCHILPLTLKETRDYIEHRVNVASRKPETLFTRPAKDNIYKYSRGIPRLINIACDRSLLAAYSLNKKKVTPSMVRIAIRELDTRKSVQTRPDNFIRKTAIAVFSIVLAAVLLLAVFKGNISDDTNATNLTILEKPPPSSEPAETIPPPIILEEPVPSEPAKSSTPSIEKAKAKIILSNIYNTATREQVMTHVLSLWGKPSLIRFDPLIKQIESDPYFFKIAARQNNLKMLHVEGGLDLVEKFNLPAIIGFSSPGHHKKGYLTIVKITPDNEYVIFSGNSDEKVRVDPDNLMSFLTGDIYIVWKNIFGYTGIISETSSKAAVVAVKLLLRQIGFTTIDLTPVYDDRVKKAIKEIQAKHGLVEDGLVGPMTKIMLAHEKRQGSIPCLTEPALSDQLKKKHLKNEHHFTGLKKSRAGLS